MQDALTDAVGRHNSSRQSMKKVIESSQLQCNMALRQQNFELGYLKCMTESRDLIEWILRIQFVMLRLIRTAKREHYSIYIWAVLLNEDGWDSAKCNPCCADNKTLQLQQLDDICQQLICKNTVKCNL